MVFAGPASESVGISFARDRSAEEDGISRDAVAEMKKAGAVIVNGLTLGVDIFSNMDGTAADAPARVNYYEAQFTNVYFRRLGPNAPIRNMDELVAHGPLVKSNT